MAFAPDICKTRPDWQAHYRIAAKLWNVLYGIFFSMMLGPNPTLGKLDRGHAWVLRILPLIPPEKVFMLKEPTIDIFEYYRGTAMYVRNKCEHGGRFY